MTLLLSLLLALQTPVAETRTKIEELSIGTTWSRIPWETCLVQAYRKAREQDKPVLIWALAGDPEGRC